MLNTAFEGFLVCLTAIFRLSIFAAFAGSIFCLCDSVCVCVCVLVAVEVVQVCAVWQCSG